MPVIEERRCPFLNAGGSMFGSSFYAHILAELDRYDGIFLHVHPLQQPAVEYGMIGSPFKLPIVTDRRMHAQVIDVFDIGSRGIPILRIEALSIPAGRFREAE